MNEYKQEASASEVIVANISDYADFTSLRKFPHAIDGLKQIHRRALFRLKDTKGKVKTITLGGQVIELHPHGDGSINDAIISMTQPFTNIVPLIASKCNIGKYSGEPPAAPRYVDISFTDFAGDVFFNKTNARTLIYVPSETGDGPDEPVYLVPAIPYSLLAGTLGIGIGYKSETVSLGLQALCTLTMKYIELRMNHLDWEQKARYQLAPYLIPDFPSHGVLRNKAELIAAYRRGDYNHPVVVDGTMTITPTSVSFNSIAPTNSMRGVTEKAIDKHKNKDGFIHKVYAEVGDLTGKEHGTTIANFEFTLRRGLNPFDNLEEIKKFAGFSSGWRPSPYYTDKNGKLVNPDPFELLNIWYNERFATILGDLKLKQVVLVRKHRELTALIIVADHADAVYHIFNTAKTVDEAVVMLVRKFKEHALTEYQAKFLASLQMQQLTRVGKDKLIADRDENARKIKEFQQEFSKIPMKMIEAVSQINDKYSKDYPRKCVIPSYIGYAKCMGNGIIQFDTLEEAENIINVFKNDVELFLYQDNNYNYLVNELGIFEDTSLEHPKQIKADKIYGTQHKAKYTACINDNGAYLLDGLVSKGSADKFVPISSEFVTIDKKGVIKREQVTKEICKKSAGGSRATLPDVIYADPIRAQQFIVVHCNSAESNLIRFELVTKPEDKLFKLVIGTWNIIGIYEVGRPMLLTVPDTMRNRTLIKHLYFKEPMKLFQENPEKATVQLSKKQINSKTPLVLRNRKSNIWTMH